MLEAATRTAAAARLRSAQVVVGSPRKSLSRGGRLLHQDISMASLGSGVSGLVGRKYSSVSPIVFMAPPEELLEGYFERPTPLLLVAGEGHAASWWGGVAAFLAARGCTVGTMALTGRGRSKTDMLTLRALQAGVAAAVEKGGLTPPVIVAHSMAGFVCQQYLQSYSASGLVLLDSFPPDPGALANEHLRLARDGFPCQPGDAVPPDLSAREFAQLMKDDPERWESLLRRHFAGVHKCSPWRTDLALQDDGNGSREKSSDVVGLDGSENTLFQDSDEGVRFPVKAFAQMCLTEPSSALRLESHVVETLVLGSGSDPASAVSALVASGNSTTPSGDGRVDLGGAKRDGLDAICDFHGVCGWSTVDREGRVTCGAGRGRATESAVPWQEVVWDWYDARF